MRNTIRQIFAIKTAVAANTFIFYFRRLWLVGRLLPETLYRDSQVKNVLSFLVHLFWQGSKLFTKAGFLAVFLYLPVFAALKGGAFPSGGAVYLAHIQLILSGLVGSMQDSAVFEVTRERVVALKYMRMPARRYVLANLLQKYALHFMLYVPGLLLLYGLFGVPVWKIGLLWLSLLSLRMAGEAFCLWLFDKTGVIFPRKTLFVWILLSLGMVLAYAPLFGIFPPLGAGFLWGWPSATLFLLGAVSVWYIRSYRFYEERVRRSVDESFLFSAAKAKAKKSAFKDVELKEKDLHGAALPKWIERLSGYAYLNGVFFARHRRMILKPVFIRLGIVVTASLAAIGFALFAPELSRQAAGALPRFLPLFVFIMYVLSTTERACRAMFYNSDISLLRYGFYRQPGVILQNFRIRLVRLAGYNLLVGLSVCAGALIFYGMAGRALWEMAPFCAAILLLSLFFTVHHMVMYYLFQPYTTELNVKNPFFRVINAVVYLISYLSMQIQTAGALFTLIVLVVTVLYIGGGLWLVFRLAPKSFRVK